MNKNYNNDLNILLEENTDDILIATHNDFKKKVMIIIIFFILAIIWFSLLFFSSHTNIDILDILKLSIVVPFFITIIPFVIYGNKQKKVIYEAIIQKFKTQNCNIERKIDPTFENDLRNKKIITNWISNGGSEINYIKNELFEAVNKYIFIRSVGRNNSIKENCFVTRIKFENTKNSIHNIIELKESIKKSLVKNIKFFIYLFSFSICLFFITIFTVGNEDAIKFINENYLEILGPNIIILLLALILTITPIVVKTMLNKNKKLLITNDEMEEKFDLLMQNKEEKLPENYLNMLFDFTNKTNNIGKLYHFYIEGEYLYIKYDILRSQNKKNILNLLVNKIGLLFSANIYKNYFIENKLKEILEFSSHVEFANKIGKKFY